MKDILIWHVGKYGRDTSIALNEYYLRHRCTVSILDALSHEQNFFQYGRLIQAKTIILVLAPESLKAIEKPELLIWIESLSLIEKSKRVIPLIEADFDLLEHIPNEVLWIRQLQHVRYNFDAPDQMLRQIWNFSLLTKSTHSKRFVRKLLVGFILSIPFLPYYAQVGNDYTEKITELKNVKAELNESEKKIEQQYKRIRELEDILKMKNLSE